MLYPWGMSELGYWRCQKQNSRLNGHKEVQREAASALHLTVPNLQDTESAAELGRVGGAVATNSSWDLCRV